MIPAFFIRQDVAAGNYNPNIKKKFCSDKVEFYDFVVNIICFSLC